MKLCQSFFSLPARCNLKKKLLRFQKWKKTSTWRTRCSTECRCFSIVDNSFFTHSKTENETKKFRWRKFTTNVEKMFFTRQFWCVLRYPKECCQVSNLWKKNILDQRENKTFLPINYSFVVQVEKSNGNFCWVKTTKKISWISFLAFCQGHADIHHLSKIFVLSSLIIFSNATIYDRRFVR